jgi:hypothetical protein
MGGGEGVRFSLLWLYCNQPPRVRWQSAQFGSGSDRITETDRELLAVFVPNCGVIKIVKHRTVSYLVPYFFFFRTSSSIANEFEADIFRLREPVLRIRIRRIHMFFWPGSGSASQRSGSGSFYHQAKLVRKTLIPTVLWLLFDFLSLKNYVNVPSKSKSNKQKYFFLN